MHDLGQIADIENYIIHSLQLNIFTAIMSLTTACSACSGLKLSEVYLLVRADRHDDGLHAVKVDVINRTQVARQLVHNFPETGQYIY